MRLALCICPQWSVQTPSFAIGSLKSHINNEDVEVDQVDLNIRSSLYTKEKNIEKISNIISYHTLKIYGTST